MKKRTAVENVEALANFIREYEPTTEEVEASIRESGKDPKQVAADMRQKINELIQKYGEQQ